MSTATIQIDRPAVVRAGAVRPGVVRPAVRRRLPERTYRRRRMVVGAILAAVTAVGIVSVHDVLVGRGGVPASAAEGRPALVRSTVTARPGDTLWSIAELHRGSVPIARYVDKLVDLNGGASIRAGQAVILP